MQDIVFYAAANETLGMVRDYTNMHNSDAPVLTIGVAVRLRMRLFANIKVPTPYPISSLAGITDWQWCMDSDFDRSTVCKLAADPGGLSVGTVTDTVNGETMDFTEFVIPISNMNTLELAAWLGNDKTKSGLTGELIGYDNAGHAAFVLQIENFKVRNRVAGLGDPTAVDLELVTHTTAERMIQTAVSSSAATKQDTLTAGFRMAIVSGSTVDQARYFAIEPAITAAANQTTTVVLSAGKAYEIHAAAANAKVLLNREAPPSARAFGLEGHAEIFVANTGYIQTGDNVVLSQPLEPDAVNNCTIRFCDNLAIISVEDHVAGYIVTVADGTTAGSLYYGLTDAAVVPQEYISVNNTLAGVLLDLEEATVMTTKHLVGNGYADTLVTGRVAIGTGLFTVANCTLRDVVVTSGVLTLSDVSIPSGSTVAVSGGGLDIKKVSGNGGTIDLGGTNVPVDTRVELTGCTIANGSGAVGGAFYTSDSIVGALVLSSAVLTGNTATNGGAIYLRSAGASAELADCLVSGNSASYGGGFAVSSGASVKLVSTTVSGNSIQDILVGSSASVVLSGGCTVGTLLFNTSGGSVTLHGSNALSSAGPRNATASGFITLGSGATLDLTGNALATPIKPAGGITFAQGGATVYPSAGSAAAYRIDNMTVPKLTNTNKVDLGGVCVIVSSGRTASASGCVFSGGLAQVNSRGGAFYVSGSADLTDCTITGNTATQGGAVFTSNGTGLNLTRCIVSGNTATDQHGGIVTDCPGRVSSSVVSGNAGGDFRITGATTCITGSTLGAVVLTAGELVLVGSNRIDRAYDSGSVTLASGATLDLTGNTNSWPFTPGGGLSLPARPANAPVTLRYTDSGTGDMENRTFHELEIRGTSISNLGVIFGATVSIPAGNTRDWFIKTTGGTIERTEPGSVTLDAGVGLTGVEEN